MSSFISYLISGISLGSVYAIIALGYTMVYGIAKMLNFAHGDVIMVGSYVVYVAVSGMGLNPILAILLSIIICTLMGVVIEGVAYRPLRNAASPLAVLITAIGVSYLLQNVALLIFGANAQTFPSVIKWSGPSLADGKLNISGETIITIAVCVIIMIALITFVHKTKPGQAMRAVSEDRGAAQLMGINVNATDDEKAAAMVFVKWMTEKSGFSYNEDGLPIVAGSTDTKLSFDGVTFLEDEPALAGEEDFLNEMNAESELNINAGGDSKIQAIIEHASNGDKTFDEIMDEWNTAWSDAQESNGIEVTE